MDLHPVIESAGEASFNIGHGEEKVPSQEVLHGVPLTSSKGDTSSSSDGRREEHLPFVAGFDMLRFKNNFLEVHSREG